MIAHRRPEFPSMNHFSFSIPARKANDNPSGESEFAIWAEGIKVGYDCFGKSEGRKSGAWARRSPRKYSHHGGDEEEFRWLANDGDESDVPSPRMWEKTGLSTVQSSSKTQQHLPTSRAQLIAGFREEMMDLVRGIPESDFELSLIDLVELSRRERAPTKDAAGGKEQKGALKKGKTRSRRSESVNSGVFLLKMFFPFSFGGRRRSSSSRRSNNSSGSSSSSFGGKFLKMSPNSNIVNEEKEGPEMNWERWNQNKLGDKSNNRDSSSSSSSSNSGRKNRFTCFQFGRRLVLMICPRV